ncbi:MAG: ATP synthase subunit C [Synergistaceae bacterium]|nr:ATP synthase subunit C [Synergistaceae bacterium]
MLGLMVLCGSVTALVGTGLWMEKRGFAPRNPKKVLSWTLVFVFATMAFSVVSAFAAEAPEAAAGGGAVGLGLLAAALSTGLACIGAGIAVAFVGAAALGVVGEKPEMLGKTMLYVGLAEGIAIYGMLISILILFMFLG